MNNAAPALDSPPVKCPTCAAEVATAGAGSVETTYLRCPVCGEVWNPVRRTTAPRQHWIRYGATAPGR
jgi:hypothetical protein